MNQPGEERHASSPEPSPPQPTLEQTLQRIESALVQLRGVVESARREEAYPQFSAARIVAVVLQLVVIALAASALMDWIFQGPLNSLLTKLAFAAFLQIVTLTALVASQDSRNS